MAAADFFLASSEGYGLESPRACRIQKMLRGRVRDCYLVVEIDPPLAGQRYGRGEENINVVVMATRHEGQNMFPVSEWPLSVHVALLARHLDLGTTDMLSDDDIELVGCGELYQTPADAARSRQ
jgi:hypothetical protein